MKSKRVLSLVLALCLCLTMLPVVTMQVRAVGYYSESDLGNIKCSILSNSARANYVNTMMRYHILSSTDNYRVARNLENGSSVVFFFDGCSDNVDDSTYGNYNNYHLSAYCAVVQKVNGVLKVVYESENCSTIPDNPRNASLNDGTAVPTVLDGVYNIISTNHLSRYASLRIADNSGSVPVIRCTSSTSYISTSNAINIHARSNFSGAPTNGICSSSYSSTGCFNVGLTNNTWSEYNNFIANVVGVSNAIKTTPYASGSWTKCTSGVDKGVVVVDRSHYKTQLAAIYGGDNSNTASNLVSKITAYTDNLDYSGHTTHTYTGSYYESAHPHKVYQMCSCGATQYTGGTTTVSTCDSCNPVASSSKYNSVLPFKAYLKGTSKIYPYTTAQLATQSGGEIWSTDECTITAVYSNGACKVTYPVGSSTKTAYTSLSNFIGSTSASLTKQTVNHQITTYIRSSTSSIIYGYVGAGDTIYKMGTSGSMTQIFYPVSSGYKLAWVLTSELTEPTYDTRFNPYCPIKGYPCATSDFDVYESDYSTVMGEIWTTDKCTINAVYADGWCQVTYPVGSSTKTGYVKLSNFVYNTSASHVKYTAKTQTTTYTNQNLSTDNGWLSAGDVFYVVSTYGSASQVLYPIDAQYGGGYKLGWIKTFELPKTTYTISYNANGGSGAPSSQTKTHGVALALSTEIPEKDGYAFVGWATSSSATSATYAPGASYMTDANITLYAVWTLNKYEITYNANGGINAPAAQNKAHGTNLTLSTAVPTKTYTVAFNANGGTVDVSTRQVSCDFLGWATSSSATSATYQPGGIFTTNSNTTLYAVWKNATLGQYSVPIREGYVFDGWYTAASGGTQVTLSTIVSSNMTVYAHWAVATYGVHYDANGGNNAPAEQIKTHGKNLILSNTIPTRENYTFLGWATEENPNEVQYHPGDTYSADIGIMLIAVWKCDLNPAFTVGSVSGKPGDTVTVPIRISENPGIIAARLKVSYDSNALTLTNVTDGGILGEYKFGDTLTANPYIVSWSNGTAQTDYSANGDLVYLTFKIKENATAGTLPITVSYDAEEIYNKSLENIYFATDVGIVNVEQADDFLGIVAQWNITLQSDFRVNFHIQINPDIEDTSSISVNIGGQTTIYKTSKLNKQNTGFYVLHANVAAAQINDKITVNVINGNSACQIFSYTVRQYCEFILSNSYYQKYHALVKEMLNYGAMAQVYFNHNTQNLANAGITGTATTVVPKSAKEWTVTDNLSNLDFYGASLAYRDRIAVRYYFTGDITECIFVANGSTHTPVAKDGMYYIEISDILPQDLEQQITLTVINPQGSTMSVAYGPMNYIVRMNKTGSTALKNLLKALYNYHLAAKALV